MLKSILEKVESRYAISRHYVSSLRIFNNEFALVEKELLRVWDENIALSYDELYVLLPYIPQDKVKFYLSKSDLFVWNANEQFININTIQIDEDMKAKISSFVSSHCLQNGYVSINDLPIETLTSEYYNVSEGALQQTVFRKVLSEQYSLNGKLISVKGENADLTTMLQRYCATKRSVRLMRLQSMQVQFLANRIDSWCSKLHMNKWFESIKNISFPTTTSRLMLM